jgi:hypothetical protein
MSSMVRTPHRRQAVPDPSQGVVVGIDVSKGRIDWRACCLGQWGSPRLQRQSGRGVAESVGMHLGRHCRGQRLRRPLPHHAR